MFDFDDLFKKSKENPLYSASWVPIYFEPMMGSGEKFTVVIAAIGCDGAVRVCNTIRPHVIKAMYGNKHTQFNSLINVIINSLNSHLSEQRNFHEWVSPISGVNVGDITKSQSTDMTGVLRQAIQLTASLSSLDFFSEENNEDQYSSEFTWANQVRDSVIRFKPCYSPYFNREFKVAGEARATKIFFLSDRIAINTDRIIPGQIATHLDRSKARIFDLLSVRDMDIFTRTTFEFIVYRPEDSDPTYNKSQIKRLNEALLEIQEVGDKHSIRVVPVTAPHKAAKRIIKAESKAA
ncbi:hypothetical protein [Morganella morganii]|uniref:hypothetical protein n=1 Tax=Morganella morganii TaxID=582 RepID=UPI00298E0135|nr:hypothetical protein [Morganella morganii]MDW7782283.1 hypothetical protein [Morganella morganii]MDW7792420.1 hypothetical protein [Morganella morganii]